MAAYFSQEKKKKYRGLCVNLCYWNLQLPGVKKKKKSALVIGFTAYACMLTKTLQLCPTLCGPIDCSLPGSPVHGIFQARILEWVAMPSSRGFFPTQGSNLCFLHFKWILYCWVTREAPYFIHMNAKAHFHESIVPAQNDYLVLLLLLYTVDNKYTD